jgi:hypothetical protein
MEYVLTCKLDNRVHFVFLTKQLDELINKIIRTWTKLISSRQHGVGGVINTFSLVILVPSA